MQEKTKELIRIEHLYTELKSFCTEVLKPDEVLLIDDSYNFIVRFHNDYPNAITQKDIIESLNIALLSVKEIGLGTTSIICSILFPISSLPNIENEISNKFGNQIITIFEGLKRLSEIYTTNLSLQTENFIKLILSLFGDIRIVLIKLAERLYKMRNLSSQEYEDEQNLASETSLLYAPIAHRLGLYNLKTELEEISMKILENSIYRHIAQKLQETKSARENFIQEFITPLKKELNQLGFNVEIKGRPKSIHSIWNKMKKQGVEFEEVYDLFAIRIIIDTNFENEKADCWRIYSIVTNHYTPNPRRLRDWISTPKASGYESLHTTVVGPEGKWVEVQIRTQRMDEIAEKGLAAHWKYKETGKSSSTDEWLQKIRSVLEKPFIEDDYFADDAKISLYSNDIFIFTPNNDIKKLKKNATVLDFAFSIHSNIGSTCTGAKVNAKIVPIKHVLKNGDKVEILTSKTQTPKQDWLGIVTSDRARSKIKRALKQQQFKKAEEGREILKRKFNQLKIAFEDEILNYLTLYYKCKSSIEFYQKVGEGKIVFTDIKERIHNIDVKKENLDPEIQGKTRIVSQSKKTDKKNYLLIDKNLDNIDFKFSKCCNPVFGDKIFGFITINNGTKIHRKDCPNAKSLWERYPYRFVETRWSDFDHSSTFLTTIFITGLDKSGIANNITKVITTDMEVEMRSITMNSKNGIFDGKIDVFIKDKSSLENLLKNIRKIKGILKVDRLKI